MGYCHLRLHKRISKFFKEGTKNDNQSTTLPPELNCQFNFLQPALPPRTKRLNEAYDVPRSSIAIQDPRTLETIVTIPERPLIKYASILPSTASI